MKEIFTIDDTLTNKVSYYHVLVFLAVLPFDRFYSELVLISWLLHELIHINKFKLYRIRMPMMITGLLYLLMLISTIYSIDKEQALRDLQKELALVVFPFLFSVTALDFVKYRNRLLKAFTLTCIITIAYLYIDALRIINFNKLPLSQLISTSFINHNFSLPVNMHATILSMYITLAAAYISHCFMRQAKIWDSLLYAVVLLFLMAAIIQLSSKAVFITMLILVNLVFPFMVLKNRSRWKFMLVSLLISFLMISVITQIPALKDRYIAGSKNDLTGVSTRNDQFEPRLLRWRYALELAEKSPLIGYGNGAEIRLLKEKYFANQLFNSYLHELNAHNQYLGYLLRMGIIGLGVYMLILYTGLKKAILAADLVFCSFVVTIAIVSFSDNILDVNKGIFFFGFFYCFFLKINVDDKSNGFAFAGS